jgi:hypothetical protein
MKAPSKSVGSRGNVADTAMTIAIVTTVTRTITTIIAMAITTKPALLNM